MFVTLIGHGSFNGGTAKFNLPGPDMSAADFDAMLQKLPTKQVVFVNTSSASGPFVEELSGPGRTIVTATRNGAGTVRHAVRRLFRRRADVRRGRRGQEQAGQRARGVQLREGGGRARLRARRAAARPSTRCSTTTATRKAARRPGRGQGRQGRPDGRVAGILSIRRRRCRAAERSEAARAVPGAAGDLERRVENLRLLKDSMPAAKYQAELERLATALALKAREITDRGRK